MTKQELLEKLWAIQSSNTEIDMEKDHILADKLLIEFIGDSDIRDAYNKIHKWYT